MDILNYFVLGDWGMILIDKNGSTSHNRETLYEMAAKYDIK